MKSDDASISSDRLAHESRGRYERCIHLLPSETVSQRTATSNRIVGGLSKTIHTIETRPRQ